VREVFGERGAGLCFDHCGGEGGDFYDGPLLWLEGESGFNQLTNLTLLQPNTVASTVAGRRGRLRPRESRNRNAAKYA